MFTANNITDPVSSPAGEIRGDAVLISRPLFEDGLLFGRFAKLETGDQVHNMDASSTPTVIGVVARDLSNPIEDGLTYTNKYTKTVSLVGLGLVTVEAVASESPTFRQKIYARNTAGANAGKASVSATNGILTSCTFVEKVTDTVWLVLETGTQA